LVALLHPDAELRVDAGGAESALVRGAAAIAGQATRHRAPAIQARFATVNGGPGIVGTVDGRVTSILAFTIADGLITEVNIMTDPRRLAALDLPRN
jgi:RNA polymerase sigma-70 factor (ECF subfamily)